MKIKRALISVSDKTGIENFARALAELGVEIISTGGTARHLRERGIAVREVSEITRFPEMMGGRLKTLHPVILGGILARRDEPGDMKSLEEHGLCRIDLVAVNLYPFEKTVSSPDTPLEEAIENIDIGGPTMVRAAAKNFNDVAVVVHPEDYPEVLNELRDTGDLSLETRKSLMAKAFRHTSQYDGAIAFHFGKKEGMLSEWLPIFLHKIKELRYGENSHQKAALYVSGNRLEGIVGSMQKQGKVLSYNNIVDIDAAVALCAEFDKPASVIIKHTNPCGCAVDSSDIFAAFKKSLAVDPVSAFGGIVALNREVNERLASSIVETFFEVIVAKKFTEGALKVFEAKKNLRIIEISDEFWTYPSSWMIKDVSGGYLIQERDLSLENLKECRVVTRRQPTEEEYEAMSFGWKVVKHVKSNAIVFSHRDRVVSVGAGQMSRIDSVKVAVMKALSSLKGTALASDAFFPFRDGVDAAFEAGATAVVQPGGSVRDEEVIRAADEHGMTMIFTGYRHFKH